MRMIGVVYALQIQEYTKPIKIGWTKDLTRRMSALTTTVLFETELLGILPDRSHKREYEIHALFNNLRIRGEWFMPSSELLSFIKKHFKTIDDLKKFNQELSFIGLKAKPPNCEQRVYDIQNVAYILNVTPDDVYRIVQSGEIDYRIIGDKILFKDTDVAKYINACRN